MIPSIQYQQVYPSKSYAPKSSNINFGGRAIVEKLGKDTYVGARNFLIQETAFFREPETLEFIKDYVMKVFKNKSEINIIDGACSCGYETFSLAMLFDKLAQKVNITGFDIGEQAIEAAKKGKFEIKSLKYPHKYEDIMKKSVAAFNDDYLAFVPQETLNIKQLEYKKMFNDFFDEIPNYKEKLSLAERFQRFLFKKMLPISQVKGYQVKPEKADTCRFVQGDILKLDNIVDSNSADVILFRNALYHLTTYEGPMGFKLPLPDDEIILAVKKVVEQVDKALSPEGLFVIGSHPSDHMLTAGETLYSELEKRGFTPALKDSSYTSVLVWAKNK